MAENKANPKQDELVAKLVKDAQAPPDTLLLSGYVGASSEDGHTRLYFDPQLSDYVEIPNDAILHTQEIPKDQSPLGGTLIWIKRDAVLVHGKVGPNRLKAKFLEGRIQQELVNAQAPAGVPGQPPLPPRTLPDAAGCPTQFGPPCGASLPFAFCPSLGQIGCPSAFCTHFGPQCQTHQLGCTHFGPNCPTVVHTVCATCLGPLCQTHQPPCTHFGPNCPTAGPTIPAICCIPPTSPLHGCPPPTPLCGPSVHVICPSMAAHLCPTSPVVCGGQTLPAAQCPITALPPCPVASGLACGGGIGSAACGGGQGGPVAEAATIVCTHVGPACHTQQQIACTIGGPACGITGPPPHCPIQSALCPTPACPTLHPIACTIGGPACGITGPQCPIQSALCPVSVHSPCFTNQPICQPSVLIPCPTQPIQCQPSVHSPCFTNQPICQPSVLTPCVTHPVCTFPPQCPIASGPVCPPVSLGCPQGPGGGGFGGFGGLGQ
jgi:hypothetical protein